MNWDQSFKDYAVKIAKVYATSPNDTIKLLRFGSVTGCLNESYLSLVRTKELEPIETLPLERKSHLWNVAKDLADEKKKRIQISRSIYLLEELTK